MTGSRMLTSDAQYRISVVLAQLAGISFIASCWETRDKKSISLVVYGCIWVLTTLLQIAYMRDKPLAKLNAISLSVMYAIGCIILISAFISKP